MRKRQKTFDESLDLMESIAKSIYEDRSKDYALQIWRRGLSSKNPSWKYIDFKVHSSDAGKERAHVLSMIDKRLPAIGFVGYFAADSVQSGADVLKKACEALKMKGIQNVYGPIDGIIINNYRLNYAPDVLFPGEPVNPLLHFECFKQAGFRDFNSYQSGMSSLKNTRLLELFKRPPVDKFPDVKLRDFDQSDFKNEFSKLIDLVNDIFPSQSVYCSEYSNAEFFYIFGDQRHMFNSRYCIFLEDKGRPVGAIFSYPHNDSLIIKTVGVKKKYQGSGISKLLIKEIHKRAREDGLKSAIYALVRDNNRISKMRRPGVKTVRKYATMKKELK